ncbi:hypothetical protein H6504_04175 [Candidatus Woesearchaeota archaeon]|nr:hypothetical protein [Candidatus Woesearchaeota archaeon]
MWRFLKKKKEPKQVETTTITIEAFPQWFTDYKVKYLKNLASSASTFNKIFEDHNAELKALSMKLEAAELLNPNITAREIDFMKGNRDAYQRSLRQLRESLRFPGDTDLIPFYCGKVKEQIVFFAKSSARPYAILQQFFANETEAISLQVKRLNQSIDELQELINSYHLDILPQVEQELEHIKGLQTHHKDLQERIIAIEEFVEAKKIEKKNNEDKLESIKQSEEYKNAQQIEHELKKQDAKIKEIHDEINNKFSVINTGLRKLQRVAFENEQLIQDYIDNPAVTLIADKQLKIIRILANLRRAITSGDVTLKDAKTEKTRQTVINMDNRYFEEILSRLNKETKQKQYLMDQFEANPTLKSYKSASSNILTLRHEIHESIERRNELQEQLKKIDLLQSVHEIEKRCNLLDTHIKIVL